MLSNDPCDPRKPCEADLVWNIDKVVNSLISMTVKQLRERLRMNALSVSGKKKELVSRLADHAAQCLVPVTEPNFMDLPGDGFIAHPDSALEVPQKEQLTARLDELTHEAPTISVVDEQSYEAANRYVDEKIRPFIDYIVEKFKGPKSKAHEAHKSVVALEKVFLEPAKRLLRKYNDARGQYVRQVEKEDEEAILKAEAQMKDHYKRIEIAESEAQQHEVDELLKEFNQLLNCERKEAAGKVMQKIIRLAGDMTDTVSIPDLKISLPKRYSRDDSKPAVRMLNRWELVDVNLLKPEYTVKVPDTDRIGRVMREHASGMVSIVSAYADKPAVRFFKQPSFLRKPKPKEKDND